jgi:uncharacterized phage protein (TIGR02220 family)
MEYQEAVDRLQVLVELARLLEQPQVTVPTDDLERVLAGPGLPPPKGGDPSPAREILAYLNQVTGRDFRPTPAVLKPIAQRLAEVKGDVDGIKAMIDRQFRCWGNDPKMKTYLRPDTLFRASKFPSYYGTRNEADHGPHNRQTAFQPRIGQGRISIPVLNTAT